MSFKLLILEKSHNRNAFDCGKELLNNYIKQQAKQDVKKKLSVCCITVNDFSKYKKVGLINAMQNFEDMPVIDIKNIFTSLNQ